MSYTIKGTPETKKLQPKKTELTMIEKWNFNFFRDLNDREVEELLEMLECLASFRLCYSIEDRREWLPDKNGGFSCKSCFSNLRELVEAADFLTYHLVWKSPLPVEIKVFGRLVALGRLNTLDILQRIRPIKLFLQDGIYCVEALRKITIIYLSIANLRWIFWWRLLS